MKQRLFEFLFTRAGRWSLHRPAQYFMTRRRGMYLPRWKLVTSHPDIKGNANLRRKLFSAVVVVVHSVIEDEDPVLRGDSISEVWREISRSFRVNEKEIDSYATRLKRKNINFDKSLSIAAKISQDNPIISRTLLWTMAYLSYCDERPSNKQRMLLETAAKEFGVPSQELVSICKVFDEQRDELTRLKSGLPSTEPQESLRDKVRDSKDPLSYALRVLGCDRSANQDQIRERYRELIFRNHPDRLLSQGSAPREIEEGRKKMLEITQAYDFLRRAMDEVGRSLPH